MDKSEQLGEEKISSLLLKFSIPAIIGMLVSAMYNIVDRIFVGRTVGEPGIAGITIGFPFMLILMAFGMLIGIGATTLVSIRLGEKKKDEAEVIFGNAFTLLIGMAIALTVAGLIFLDPLLRLSGASEAILPYARDFMRIILFGSIFQNISFGMNNFIRAEGNPKIAMFTMLIGAILNIILDAIFVLNFGWGVQGAALATIISQAVSAVWVLYYFLGKKSMLKIHIKNLKLQWPIITQIAIIGSAPFAMQMVASVLSIIINNSLKLYGGDVAIAGMGIINSIAMLILMPIFGINQGVQPIIGFNYGAKKFDRVKHALKLAVIAATIVVTIGFIITQLFTRQIISIFSKNEMHLVEFSVHALRVFLLFLPIIGFQIVGASYFQAVGKPKQAMLLSLSRQVILLIPAILILPIFFKLEGILIAGPVADLGASIITAIWIYRELKNLDDKHQMSYIVQAQTD